jgi:hypothetical protein
MQTLADSSWWHCQGCFSASNTVGAKYWDQGAKGYLIPNMEKCEGISHSMDDNKCTRFLPKGIPRGPIYRGG